MDEKERKIRELKGGALRRRLAELKKALKGTGIKFTEAVLYTALNGSRATISTWKRGDSWPLPAGEQILERLLYLPHGFFQRIAQGVRYEEAGGAINTHQARKFEEVLTFLKEKEDLTEEDFAREIKYPVETVKMWRLGILTLTDHDKMVISHQVNIQEAYWDTDSMTAQEAYGKRGRTDEPSQPPFPVAEAEWIWRAPGIVYQIDAHTMRNTLTNQGAQEYIDLTAREIRALDFDALCDFVHPEERAAYKDLLKRLAASADGESGKLTYRLRDGEGAYRWFEGELVVVENGQQKWLIGTAVDITEQKIREAASQDPIKIDRLLHHVADTFRPLGIFREMLTQVASIMEERERQTREILDEWGIKPEDD